MNAKKLDAAPNANLTEVRFTHVRLAPRAEGNLQELIATRESQTKKDAPWSRRATENLQPVK